MALLLLLLPLLLISSMAAEEEEKWRETEAVHRLDEYRSVNAELRRVVVNAKKYNGSMDW